MELSSNWLGHQPFTLKTEGSNPRSSKDLTNLHIIKWD